MTDDAIGRQILQMYIGRLTIQLERVEDMAGSAMTLYMKACRSGNVEGANLANRIVLACAERKAKLEEALVALLAGGAGVVGSP